MAVGFSADGHTPLNAAHCRPSPLLVQGASSQTATLRRRRLRELRGLTNAPLAQHPFPDRGDRWTGAWTVRSALRPQPPRLTPVPAVASQDLSGRQVVVEIHVPLNGSGGILPGEPGYEFGWIDDIEKFLADESSDGSFDIYDDGEDFSETYVFFLAGAPKTSCYTLLRTSPHCPASRPVPSPWSLTTRARRSATAAASHSAEGPLEHSEDSSSSATHHAVGLRERLQSGAPGLVRIRTNCSLGVPVLVDTAAAE